MSNTPSQKIQKSVSKKSANPSPIANQEETQAEKCIVRSCRTVNPDDVAQLEEEKARWSGLYLKCATWSVLL